MNQKNTPQIPVKWLVVLVFALVVYGLGQPFANRKFGWRLPSLASILGQKEPAAADKNQPAEASEKSKQTKQIVEDAEGDLADGNDSKSSPDKSNLNSTSQKVSKPETDSSDPKTNPNAKSNGTSSKSTDSKSADSKSTGAKATGSKSTSSAKPTSESNKVGSSKNNSTSKSDQKSGDDKDLLYGLLKEIGNEDYQSPSGLRFTRGSEEGHRLKHLERHLEDQPSRPGKHGVFYGDMEQVVRWLDEAYERGTSGAKGTTKSEEDGRTVYEVNFSKPIGYIGGSTGARQKNPDSKRLRMVVEKDRLITAFPF